MANKFTLPSVSGLLSHHADTTVIVPFTTCGDTLRGIAKAARDPLDEEHDQLAEAHRELVEQFRLLSKAPFDASEHRNYLARLAEHLEALRRHLAALKQRP